MLQGVEEEDEDVVNVKVRTNGRGGMRELERKSNLAEAKVTGRDPGRQCPQ